MAASVLIKSFVVALSFTSLAVPAILLADEFQAKCELLWLRFNPTDVPEARRKIVFNEIVRLSSERKVAEVNPHLEARRFLYASDWSRYLDERPLDVWNSYGEVAWKNWLKGADFVYKNYKAMSFDVAELHQIHRLVLQGSYLKGYEQRRVRQAMTVGLLSKSEGDVILSRISNGERVYFSGVDHQSLIGSFRSEELDDDLTQGRPLRDRGGAITKQDFDALRSNQKIKITSHHTNGNLIDAYIEFPKSVEVASLVEKELQTLRQVIQSDVTLYEKFTATMRCYHELISIHPYLNGNGRAMRLFIDAVLLRLGLSPAVHNFDREFTARSDEVSAYALLGMADFVQGSRY